MQRLTDAGMWHNQTGEFSFGSFLVELDFSGPADKDTCR